MKNRYELNENNELIRNDSGNYIAESFVETYENLTDLHFQGIPRYYLKDGTITERTEIEITEAINTFRKPIWDGTMFTEGLTKDELDSIEKDRLLAIAQSEHKEGYGTIGLSFDSELKGQLERTIKKLTGVAFTELIDIIYRNELRDSSSLSDFVTLDNFMYDERELALGDKGRVYPYNLNQPSTAKINIGNTNKRFIAISSLSIIVEKGYVPGESLFIWAEKDGNQYPLIPFNTRPYTCFGYFDFGSDFSGETTIGITFSAGEFQDRAYISDIRVAQEL